jgi:hypothetical protein
VIGGKAAHQRLELRPFELGEALIETVDAHRLCDLAVIRRL